MLIFINSFLRYMTDYNKGNLGNSSNQEISFLLCKMRNEGCSFSHLGRVSQFDGAS